MSGGEWFVFVFVGIVFCIMIYVGIRLFLWNQRDRKRLDEKNNRLKNQD